MRIGARVIKTGIAVGIAMFLCKTLNLQPSAFGAVTAVINMQPSIYLTFKTTRDQILIHIIGVVLGISLGYIFGGNPITMGLTTVLIIAIYTRFKLQHGIVMGLVAAIFILDSPPETFLLHAMSRSLVIFVGLSVAMIVNIALWPPRYKQQFLSKLRESNELSARYFCHAVLDFVYLDKHDAPNNEVDKNKLTSLNNETRQLARHLQLDNGNITKEQEDHLRAAREMMLYNEALEEKANRIYELIPARIERRAKSGTPPISQEFKSILSILENGCPTILRINAKLRAIVCEKQEIGPEQFDDVYWESLTEAVEEWQQHLTSSYYLQALIEAAVVANELRWAARECKIIINRIQRTGQEGKAKQESHPGTLA